MPDILVEGKDVARRFSHDILALQAASFAIRSGDRIALLGRSGSGKSTLLHLIAGLDAPTGGALSWPALGQNLHRHRIPGAELDPDIECRRKC